MVLIIASQYEAEQIKDLSDQETADVFSPLYIVVNIGNSGNITNTVSLDNDICNGIISAINDKMEKYKAGEIIFSAADLTSSQIITLMIGLKDYSIEFRIAHTDSKVIIGSNFVSIGHKKTINT